VGLNWSEGLKAGAQGLTLMQRNSEHKTDMLYKQISDANMMRFKEREFQADTKYRSDTLAETTRSRKATEALTKSTQESTAAYRETSSEQAASRLTETQRHNKVSEGIAVSSESRRRVDSLLDAKEKEIEALGIMPDEAQLAPIHKKYERKIARAELPNDGAKAFDRAMKTLADTPDTLDFATRYGRMSAAERKTADANAAKMIKGGMGKSEAMARAIGSGQAEFIQPEAKQMPDPAAGVTPTKGEGTSAQMTDPTTGITPDKTEGTSVQMPDPAAALPTGSTAGSGGSGSVSVAVNAPAVTPEDKAALEGMFNPKQASAYSGSVSQAVNKKQALKQAEAVLSKIQTSVEAKQIIASLNLPQEQKDSLMEKWYKITDAGNKQFIESKSAAEEARAKVQALRDYNTQG